MTNSSEKFKLLLTDLWSRQGDRGMILTNLHQEGLALAVDAAGHRHVLAPVTDDYAFKPVAGQAIELSEWRHPQTQHRYMDLVCLKDELAQVFESLSDEIIRRAEEQDPHVAVLQALDEFEDLLRPSRMIAEETARGLFGELVTLGWLAERNPLFAVELWRGQESHAHDFSSTPFDLEVKSCANDGSTVTVSSLHQLDEIAGTPLLLLRLHVQTAPQGENLGDLVDHLDTLGCNRAELVSKLEAGGFRLGIDADDHRFALVDAATRVWRVGPDFPGLRSTDLPEDRRDAIRRVTYTLELASAPGAMTSDEFAKALDIMVAPQ